MKKIKQMGLLLLLAVLVACDKPAEPAPPDIQKAFQINGKRVALVIGNADYENLTKLPNDVNDAEDMAALLTQFGFTVTPLINATKEQFAHGLQAFSQQLDQDTVGLIYYSGHGAEIDNRQYLVPVDAKTDKAMFKKENFDVQGDILPEVQNKARFMMLILDACRNNPFAKAWNLPKGQVPNGFNKMSEVHGVLIASATASGDVSDGAGERNSVYTAQLLNHLRANSGEEVTLLLKDVGTSVRDVTNQDQSPWISPEYDGRFYFAQAIDDEEAKRKAEEAAKQAQIAENLRLAQLAAQQAEAERLAAEKAKQEARQAFEPEMVQLPNGKWMGKYEVTIGEYMACVEDGGCKNPEWLKQGSEYNINTGSKDYYKKAGMSLNNNYYPITGVSWNDTQTYIVWLNGKTNKSYRLPTEEEWFAACQAGQTTEYCGSNNLNKVAWYQDNLGNTTHPVGQKIANAWGLKDMSGNVWEWTSSVYKDVANSRVVRGGSWNDDPVWLRSAMLRYRFGTSFRDNDLGFRLSR